MARCFVFAIRLGNVIPQQTSSPTNVATASAPKFVQGMGLFSATAIVMGSMIGSGIFIVPADMSRVLGSPALLIAAWLVTALMTIIGALSYGELAAMMPKAGGQYVYLRESLGPIWGFLYGWTLFLVIQTGTIAAVGVAFGKFLGVFFPSVSQTHWIWHVGSGNIGLNTANLAAIVDYYAAHAGQYARREAGRGGAERVYQCEGAGAAGDCGGGAGGEERGRDRGELRRGLACVLGGKLQGMAHAACRAGGRGSGADLRTSGS